MAKCHARLVLSLCCTSAAAHNDDDDEHDDAGHDNHAGHVGGHVGGHGIDQDHDYDVEIRCKTCIVSLLHIGCCSQ